MQVLSPNSEEVKLEIEALSDQFYPYVIRFVNDGSGQLFIPKSVAEHAMYETIQSFIISNTHVVDYVPPVEE